MLVSRVELFRREGCWMVEIMDPDQVQMEVFGLPDDGRLELPTAFMATMPEGEVVRRIAALNPGADVTVRAALTGRG